MYNCKQTLFINHAVIATPSMEFKSEFMRSMPNLISCIKEDENNKILVNNASFYWDNNKTGEEDSKTYGSIFEPRNDAHNARDFGNSISALGSSNEFSSWENTIYKKYSTHDNIKFLPCLSMKQNNSLPEGISTNIEYNAFENTTMKQNNISKSTNTAHSGIRGGDSLTYCATTVQSRCYTEMSPFDYTKFNDFDGSYNNEYISNYDNLSSCCDVPVYTTTTAHKQYLQQQRKYAIMMEMTTSSVIASGETRVPVERIMDRPKLTIDRLEEYDNSAVGKMLYEGDNDNFMNIDDGIKDFENGVNVVINNQSKTTTTDANVIENLYFKPVPLSLPTSTNKLPKLLPTPNYTRNGTDNNNQRKLNVNAKKLPRLPIEIKQINLINSKILKETSPPATFTNRDILNTNLSLKATSTGELNDDNISLSVGILEPNYLSSFVLSPLPAAVTKISTTKESMLYRESYLTHFTDRIEFSETSAPNKSQLDIYLASIKRYTPMMSEKIVSSTTVVEGFSSQTKCFASTYLNPVITSNIANDTTSAATAITSRNVFVDCDYIIDYGSKNKERNCLSETINNNFNDYWIDTSAINSSIMASATKPELLFYLKQDVNNSFNSSHNINVSSYSRFLHTTLSSLSTPLYTYIALPTTAPSVIEKATTAVKTMSSSLIQSENSLPTFPINFPSSSRHLINSTNKLEYTYSNSYSNRDNDYINYTTVNSSNVCKIVGSTYYTGDLSTYVVPQITAAATYISNTIASVTQTAAKTNTAPPTTAEHESQALVTIPLTCLATENVLNFLSKNDFTSTNASSPSAAVSFNRKNICRVDLITTTLESVNITESDALSESLVTIADTTTTSYSDYLTQCQTPVTLILDTSAYNYNATITKGITDDNKSDLSHFMICDRTIENNHKLTYPPNREIHLEENLNNMNALSRVPLLNEAYVVTEKRTVNNCPTENISAVNDIFTQIAKLTSTVEKHDESQIFPIGTNTTTLIEDPKYEIDKATVSENFLKNIALKTTIGDLLSFYITNPVGVESVTDSDLFSSSCPLATSENDGNDDGAKVISVTETRLPLKSVLTTSTFNDTLYDSYNKDLSETTVPINDITDTPSVFTTLIATNMVSYKEVDELKIELLKTTLDTDSVISEIAAETASGTHIRSIYPLLEDSLRSKKRYKTLPTATQASTNIPMEINISQHDSYKTRNMIGSISKGIKTGLDGVLYGVNNVVATTDSRVKEQQKKIGFNFSISSKFVPSVGGLIAGATAAVQQTSMIKADQGSNPESTLLETNNNVAYVLAASVETITAASKNSYLSNSELDNGSNAIDCNVNFNCKNTENSQKNQSNDPTSINSGNMDSKQYFISGGILYGSQEDFLSNDMTIKAIHSNICNDNECDSVGNSNITNTQQRQASKNQVMARPLMQYNIISNGFCSVPSITDMDNEIAYTTCGNTNNLDYNNDSYADQIRLSKGVADVDSVMVTSGKEKLSYQSHQQGMEPTTVERRKEMSKLPIPHMAMKLNLASPSYRSDTESMIGSFLGKAATAVQSATQAVNEVTAAVQQKASLATSTEAELVLTTEMDNQISTDIGDDKNDYESNQTYVCNIYHHGEEQQKSISQRSSCSSQLSVSAIDTDCENKRSYYCDNSIITTATVALSAELDTNTTAPCPPCYLNNYQSHLQQQRQQSFKILPAVPLGGSLGKKLPTINSNKTGVFIRQLPNEMYDVKLNVNGVMDTSEFLSTDFQNDNEFSDEGGNNMDFNGHELSDIDCKNLDEFTAEDGLRNSQNSQQQRLHPSYNIGIEQDNYYLDSHLTTTPSDSQQNLSPQYQQKNLDTNNYYENFDGGYNYQEDYFNEEDEYKYLAKEQEFLCKQQHHGKLLKQKQTQRQHDRARELYLENTEGNFCHRITELTTKTNKNQEVSAELHGAIVEDDSVTNNVHFKSPSVTEGTLHTSRASSNALCPVIQPQQQLKKQGSIIIEEKSNAAILFNGDAVLSNSGPTEKNTAFPQPKGGFWWKREWKLYRRTAYINYRNKKKSIKTWRNRRSSRWPNAYTT
ncbi:serine-rich adhesin for platelets-like [Eurosta solidaginis]|uniref:serine-rich adhesin for platelets-like n=1 Tax=Eurosta solidaginis TaxID=178769 RepID=UPI0035305F4E